VDISLAHGEVVEDGARCDRRPVGSGYARHRIDHLDAIAICHHLNAQFCSTRDKPIQRLLNLLLDSHGIPPSIGAELIDRGRQINSSTTRHQQQEESGHKTTDHARRASDCDRLGSSTSSVSQTDPPAGVRANRATSTLTWPDLTHQFARAVLDISVLQADELPAQAESIGA
jgi:hypothetical protein